MRLVSFDYFRGVAILFIVAGHSFGTWSLDTFSGKVLANIIYSGTALFVFISGFFFHHIFHKDFDLKIFMEKKTNNVLIPYLILSTLGFIYFALSSESFPFLDRLISTDGSSWTDYIQLYVSYQWTGRIMYAYWYIPFIMIIFLISPLFIAYIRLSLAVRLSLMLILLLFSAFFVHRPILNMSPIHSVIYYIPVYLIGINCSINRQEIEPFIKGKMLFLGFIVLALAVIQSIYFDSRGAPSKANIFSYGGVDINIFQKIALCFFFISLLHRYENTTIPGLKLLASSSFTIYFLHTWVLHITNKYHPYGVFSNVPEILVWLGIIVFTVATSMLIAYSIKAVLKHNSRYVIGW
jgi:fucose 4-O-acetylase-like acetyltransferase